jgi:hypothetical protein
MPSLKNNEFRASQIIMILRIIIIFDLLMIVFDLLELNMILKMIRGVPLSQNAEKQNNIRQLMLSIFYTIVSFCSGLAFLGWLYRSYSNINRLGFEKTRYAPSWTIYSFLIPVVNIYLPYIIMRETYCKNKSALARAGENPENAGEDNLFFWWWTFWLLSIGTSLAYLLLLKLPMTKDNRITLILVSIISDIVDIPAAFLAIKVISRISRIEKHLFRISGNQYA